MGDGAEIARDSCCSCWGACTPCGAFPSTSPGGQPVSPPLTRVTLHGAARALGLQDRVRRPGRDRLAPALPAVAGACSRRLTQRHQAQAPSPCRASLIPQDRRPQAPLLPRRLPDPRNARRRRRRRLLRAPAPALLPRGAPGEEEILSFPGSAKAFGFRWFIPELLKPQDPLARRAAQPAIPVGRSRDPAVPG